YGQEAGGRVVLEVREPLESRPVLGQQRRAGMAHEQLVADRAPARPCDRRIVRGADLRIQREDPPLPVEELEFSAGAHGRRGYPDALAAAALARPDRRVPALPTLTGTP